MLGQLFTRAGAQPEERNIQPWGDWRPASTSYTGVNVSETSSLQLLTVYASVALIADTIATLPTDVYQRTADVPRVIQKPPWLENPNDYTDATTFFTQSLWSLLLCGNAYWQRGIDQRQVTNGLTVIDPARMSVRIDKGTVTYQLDGRPIVGQGLTHIKGISRPGDVVGYSPIEAARQSIGLGLAAQEFAARFYSNGAALSGAISTDADLTTEQANQLQDSWARAHSGLSNAHRPGVLDNGATWTPIAVTPEQAQFLQSRNFQAAEIAGQLFLLDPTMLGIPLQSASLTYANLEQRGIHLVQFTLLRWITRLENAVSALLPRSQFFKFNVAGLERADLKTRYEADKIGIEAGFLLRNEVREKEDLVPLPEELKVNGADAETIAALVGANFDPDSVIAAVTTGDLTKLKTKETPAPAAPLQAVPAVPEPNSANG